MPGEKIDAESRRRQILDTAFRIASRDRLEGISIRAVAREAGVSMGLVSFYFGSKEGLLVALLKRVVDTVFTIGFRATDEQAAPNERLFSVVANTLELILDRPSDVQILLDYWIRAGQETEISEIIRGALATFRDSMQVIATEMIGSQPERYAGVTPAGLASIAMSTIEGTMFQVVLFPGELDKAHFMRALDALVNGHGSAAR